MISMKTSVGFSKLSRMAIINLKLAHTHTSCLLRDHTTDEDVVRRLA